MKKTAYEPTLVELLKLDAEDVIATSGGDGSIGGSDNEHEDEDQLEWASLGEG